MVDEQGDYPLAWAAVRSIAARPGCKTGTLRLLVQQRGEPQAFLARAASGAGRKQP
jgi:hypothetical protein